MGRIYLYTGTCAGKTANALSLAPRSIGHKRKVIIIQFLKWRKNTDEYRVRSILSPNYEIYQFGRRGWIGLSNLNDQDRQIAERGLKFAAKIVKEKKPNLLVLDEINLAIHCKLLDARSILDLLDGIPKKKTWYSREDIVQKNPWTEQIL